MGTLIDVGSFIKLQRTKQGITQGELAGGIVSLSYLSKIENNKTDASPEILQMLCSRLGIQLSSEEDPSIQEKCQNWFDMLYEANDKSEIIATYEELQEIMDKNLSENLLLFEIHKIRYYLILGEVDKALEKINELNELSSAFEGIQKFYWYKFRGNFNSINGEFNQALRLYRLADEKIKNLELPEDQIADLQYTLAVTHSKLRNTLEVIDHAERALEIYMKEYNFMRCAQCHIVLGISYRRIKMYEKAIKNYNLARHLGELNKDNHVIQLTNLNLGYLYSALSESNEAIKFFTEVVEDEEVLLYERLAATTSLVKEYYKVGNYEKAQSVIQKALYLLKDTQGEAQYKLFHYITYTYIYAINDQRKDFISLVTDKFIPYLQKHKDYANLVVYSNMLAEYLEKLGKYKESVKYYKLSNVTYEELINL
ncbi:helix-turn-helix domain-containing protein [Virgibacillus halodenitrificans]|uniref:helix-turn-helix domain-containing protein n=1 Tax=Virgibacillus halodenitrificans TaxID=1482 RepID=UPI002DD43E82|nr:helix-turn-helix domain-containing protein [Virgibacillus halodenitrificans]